MDRFLLSSTFIADDGGSSSSEDEAGETWDWNEASKFSGRPALCKQDRLRLQKMDEELRCPICRDPFDVPMRFAACGHTFCSKCIRGYLSAPKTGVASVTTCPGHGCGDRVHATDLLRCTALGTTAELFFAMRPALLALVRRGAGAVASEEEGGDDDDDGDGEERGGSTAVSSSSSSSSSQRMQHMGNVQYHGTKVATLKQWLRKLSTKLSLVGDRNALIQRHKRFLLEHNVQCDSGVCVSSDVIAERVASLGPSGANNRSSGSSRALRATLGSMSADPTSLRRAIEERSAAAAAATAAATAATASVSASAAPVLAAAKLRRGQLPPPWRTVWSSNVNRIFYYNSDERIGQWDPPPCPAVAPPAAASSSSSTSLSAATSHAAASLATPGLKRPRSGGSDSPGGAAGKRGRSKRIRSQDVAAEERKLAGSGRSVAASRAKRGKAKAKGREYAKAPKAGEKVNGKKTKASKLFPSEGGGSEQGKGKKKTAKAKGTARVKPPSQPTVSSPAAAATRVLVAVDLTQPEPAVTAAAPAPVEPAASGSSSSSLSSPQSKWPCGVCTFINPPTSDKCAMCTSPRPRNFLGVLRQRSSSQGGGKKSAKKGRGGGKRKR